MAHAEPMAGPQHRVARWDGNVLAVSDASGRTRMTGLVERRALPVRRPAAHVVSPHLLRRTEAEHPLVRGWQAKTDGRVVPDEAACRRLTLYRLHLYPTMPGAAAPTGTG